MGTTTALPTSSVVLVHRSVLSVATAAAGGTAAPREAASRSYAGRCAAIEPTQTSVQCSRATQAITRAANYLRLRSRGAGSARWSKGGSMRHNEREAGSGGVPAVVLVHGAFSDASIWWGVIAELRAHGIVDVIAPAVPLRGLSSDAAYVESISNRFAAGPVLFVGHSYGAAVADAAAARSANAVGLVHVAGFALDVGESTSSAGAGFAQSELAASVVPVPYRTESGASEIDLFLRQDAFARRFRRRHPGGDGVGDGGVAAPGHGCCARRARGDCSLEGASFMVRGRNRRSLARPATATAHGQSCGLRDH